MTMWERDSLWAKPRLSGAFLFRLLGRFALTTLLALAAQPPAKPVFAATTITVTTTADEVSNNGQCSLREAILAASRNAPMDTCGTGSSTAADTIVLPVGLYQIT